MYRFVVWQIILCGLCPCWRVNAQEGAGQAEISFQQYYLSVNSQRVSDTSGMGLSFTQFIPNTGLVSGSLLPALSNSRFRSGDSYLQLNGLPLKGQHWTLTGGDFRIPAQLLSVSFGNLNFPVIAARGGAAEATHGSRTIGFFWGQGAISNTPRVMLLEQVPQTVLGVYWRQQVGTRLLLGARFMRFSNDIVALRRFPGLLTQTPLTSATTLSLDSLYTVAGRLKFFDETSWSLSTRDGPNAATRNVPISTLAGPMLDTKMFTLHANYTFQNAAYFPLLGFYIGDRAGPFGEVRFRPSGWLEIYASASEYENNVARDPTLANFRNSSESAGASILLPARISVNAQYTALDLSTRVNAGSPWIRAADRQKAITVSRPIRGHNIRVTVREFQEVSTLDSQRQRSVEVGDNFRIRRLTLGGGVKLQHLITDESRSSVLFNGSAQFGMGRLSLYANVAMGNDLQNRTLLATNTVSTTVVGANATLGRNWQIQAEAYRNNLLTELNPQSILCYRGRA